VNVDVLLVGGGLANSLIAWRLAQVRPSLRVRVVEKEARLGGNHTWCCHASDLSSTARNWLEPLVAHAWRGHAVRFPRYSRILPGGYLALTSGRLHDWVAALVGPDALRLGSAVRSVDAGGAVLASGERLDAKVVIDGRGWPGARGLDVRFQKFLGLEVELARPHGLARPVLMDATVSQLDGYRFVYVLPLGPRRVLVEDTRYSDGPRLSTGRLRESTLEYVSAQGWEPLAVEREEAGVLPVALGGDPERFLGAPDGVARVGLRGALFHPTTGYSLPDAVRVASAVAADPLDDGRALAARVRRHSLATWRRRGFFRFLNRMLFQAAAPEQRYRVMQRFYRLDASLIDRFYAGELRYRDHVRLLTGRPPVPITRALACIAERPRRAGAPS
jgi:lycopene beta-cyclase